MKRNASFEYIFNLGLYWTRNVKNSIGKKKKELKRKKEKKKERRGESEGGEKK